MNYRKARVDFNEQAVEFKGRWSFGERQGLHAFRRGCNRRWELAGIVPAVVRQQMGHTSAAMTRLYSGRIPDEQVEAAFSMKNRSSVVQMENMENEAAA
ncbi:MAG TPA: hypothetical protein VIX91_06370 [Candidatus Acidoferrum sp.]